MHCTFQPNSGKKIKPNIEATVNKLYQDGVNKYKVKREDKKDPQDEEYSFQPKVNQL